jgi:hypothetical protein
VALNSARTKAKEARLKAELSQVRSQMELYYKSNGGYGATGGSNCSTGANNPFVTGTDNASTLIKGITNDRCGSTSCNLIVCASNADAWAVSVQLFDGASSWCVDSNGASKPGIDSNTNLPTGSPLYSISSSYYCF